MGRFDMTKEQYEQYQQQLRKRRAGMIGAGVIAGAVILSGVIGFTGLSHVSTGNVGIAKHTNGTITEVPAGWSWTGYAVSVQEYPTYTQSLVLSDNAREGGKDSQQWLVGTADQQEIPVNTSLTWSINPHDATTLYQSIGGKDIDYVKDSIVLPTLKSVVNRITHDYGWNDIKGSRQGEVTDKINEALKTELAKVGVVSGKFGFLHVGSPKGMDQAQQSLAASELSTKQAQAAQDKAKVENATKILNAQTDAQANEIEAQGIKAKASAMNEFTIQEKAIEKWDGHTPQYMAGNSTPFVNIGGK